MFKSYALDVKGQSGHSGRRLGTKILFKKFIDFLFHEAATMSISRNYGSIVK